MKKKIIALFSVLIFLISSFAPVFVMNSASLSNNSTANQQGTNTNLKNFLSHRISDTKYPFNISEKVLNKLNSKRYEILFLYDSGNNITSAAVKMFVSLIAGKTSYLAIPIQTISEYETALTFVKSGTLVISVFHGLPDAMRIANQYYQWQQIYYYLAQSPANHQILASCYSSVLNTNTTSLKITGIENMMDYEVAVPILSLTALAYLYEIDHIPRPDATDKLQYLFNHDMNFLVDKILDPTQPLSGNSTHVLRHYTFSEIQRIQSVILGVTNYMNTSLAPIIRNILQPLIDIIPPDLRGSILGSYNLSNLDQLSINLASIPNKYLSELNNGVNFQNITLVNQKIPTSIGNITVFVDIIYHSFLNSDTQYQFTADVVDFGFEFQSNDFVDNLMVGPVPITIKTSFDGMYTNEILINYASRDPNWFSNGSTPLINPALYTGSSPNNATSLLGYVTMPGPFKDITLESWFGMPDLGIPIWYRGYGSFVIKLDASLGIDYGSILAKLGDSSSQIQSALDSITGGNGEADLPIGSTSLYVYFTTIKNGIEMNVQGTAKIGLDLNFSSSFLSGALTINFTGQANFNIYFSGTAIWNDQGVYLSQLDIYYPRVDIALVLNIQLKFSLLWYNFDMNFHIDPLQSAGITMPFYFPNGNYVAPPSGVDFNLYSEGRYTYDNSTLKIDAPLNTTLGSLTTSLDNAISGSWAGVTNVTAGSITDSTPPIIAFITPNTVEDPAIKMFGAAPSTSDQLYVTDPTTGKLILFNSTDIVNDTFMGNNGSVSMEAVQGKPIPLFGDNASINIYTFDQHNAINTGSYIESVQAKATFAVKSITLGMGIHSMNIAVNPSSNPCDSSTSNSTICAFQPLSANAKDSAFQRLYLNITNVKYTSVFVLNDKNNVVFNLSNDNISSTGFVGWTPWTLTKSLRIEIWDFFPCDTDTSFCMNVINTDRAKVSANVNVIYGQVQFIKTWSSTDSAALKGNYANLTDGVLFQDPSSVKENSIGIGPASKKTGWSANWTLEMPLQKFYTEGLINDHGWILLQATATSNSTLSTTITKFYYYVIPHDIYSPQITSISSNLGNSSLNPDLNIAGKGIQQYDVNISDPIAQVHYVFDYGNKSSTYNLFSSVSLQNNNQVSLFEKQSHVIEVTGTGTQNEFSYSMNRQINATEGIFSAEIKMTGSYVIYLSITDNAGIDYLEYNSSYSGNPQASNGYLLLPTNETQINTGNWSQFYVDVQADLHKYNPNGTVTVINAFLIRGSAEIDNIMVDNNILMNAEDGSTNGWSITVSSPSGASIKNIYIDKPQMVSTGLQWTGVNSTKQYFSNVLVAEEYQLTIDTSQFNDGIYALSLTAFDGSGNSVKNTYWVIIDNDPPNVAPVITSLKDVNGPCKTTTSGTICYVNVYVYWNPANDTIGIKSYNIYRNGYLIGSASGSSTEYVEQALGGSYIQANWTVQAVDYGGNTKMSPTYNYNSYIFGYNVSYSDSASPGTLSVTFSWNSQYGLVTKYSDTESATASGSWFIDIGPSVSVTDSSTYYTAVFSVTFAEYGVHYTFYTSTYTITIKAQADGAYTITT